MKPTGVRSPSEFQRLDLNVGHQDGSPSEDRQGDMPFW